MLSMPTYFFRRSSSISASSRCRAMASGSVSFAFSRNSARWYKQVCRRQNVSNCGWLLPQKSCARKYAASVTFAAGDDVLRLLDAWVVPQSLEKVTIDRQCGDTAAHPESPESCLQRTATAVVRNGVSVPCRQNEGNFGSKKKLRCHQHGPAHGPHAPKKICWERQKSVASAQMKRSIIAPSSVHHD